MDKADIRRNFFQISRQEKLAARLTRREFLGTLGALSASTTCLLSSSFSDSRSPVILENSHFRYSISAEGQNLGFLDKRSRIEYFQGMPPSWFITLKKGEHTLTPSSCVKSGNRIVASFREIGTTVVCAVKNHRHYFTIEVDSVEGEPVEELRLL